MRLRWSLKEGFWHLEQKAPAKFVELLQARNKRPDPYLDEVVRMRDGYTLVMRLAATPQVECPNCQQQLAMPVMETKEVKCMACQRKGYNVVLRGVAYWPFNDRLLNYIQSLAPGKQHKHRDKHKNEEATRLAEGLLYRELSAGLHDSLLDQLARSTRPS